MVLSLVIVDCTTNPTSLKKQHIIHFRYLRIQGSSYHSEKRLLINLQNSMTSFAKMVHVVYMSDLYKSCSLIMVFIYIIGL